MGAEVKVDLKDCVEGGDGDCGWEVYRKRFMLSLPRVGDV